MKTIFKKGIAAVLTCAMVFGLVPVSGITKVHAAEPEPHGEHSVEGGWIDLETKYASDALNPQYRIEESGKYYLSTDITKQVYVGGTDIDVILCLNGHNISYDSQSTAAVVVYGSVNLTITDCNDKETKSYITDTSGYGAGIEQRGNATVKLENVAVKSTGDNSNGIEIVSSSSSSSGNLELDNSTVEAKGAAINKGGNGYIKISNSTLGNSSYYLNDSSYYTIYTSDYNSEPIENITISNSTFYGGVEINSVCNNLTLTKSDFHSGSTCFRLVGGNAVVTDCDFMRSSDLKSATGFYMGVKDSTLAISGGKFSGLAKGIRYEYDDNPENAKKDLTLEGNIIFDGISYSDYTQCADLYVPALADINLHLNNLETRNITMSAPDSNKPSIICDSDYSSYFKNVKYIFSSEETEDGKCRLISTERAITSQPNNDTKAVEVNDGENASYQWSRVRATTKTVKDVEADDVIVPTNVNNGTYNSDNGVWQPREITSTYGTPTTRYYYNMNIPFTGKGIVILENPNSSLENIKSTFNVQSNNKNATCRMVDGKLYFEVSDANEKVSLSGQSGTYSELVITVINIADETELEGHNESSLGAVEDGSYRCYVTWNKDDDVFKYETVSNIFDLVSHIWKYSENGNQVLAYCDGSHTGCEYTGVDKAVSLTLTAEDKEYSGSEYNGASVTDNISSVVTNAVVGNITYYLSDGSTQTTFANSGAAGEGQAPVNVGKYVAKITVSGVTASKAFEIKAPHTHNGVKQNGKAATCTTDGWKDYYQCSCDAFYEDEACTAEITDLDAWKTAEGKIAALGHDFAKIWEKDAESHYHKCTRCSEIKDKAAHTYGEWSVEKQATEAEAGLRKRSCSVCGYEQTEPLYAITLQNDGNGTASADKTNAVEGETVTLSVAPKENYALEKWEVTPDTVSITDNKFTMPAGAVKVKAVFRYVPTAEDKIAEAKTAVEEILAGITATNDTTKEEIQKKITDGLTAKGITDVTATVGDLTKTAATAEAAGSITGKITVTSGTATGEVDVNLAIAKLTPSHTHSLQWIIVREATETTAGEMKGVCSGCDYEETKEIPVLGTSGNVIVESAKENDYKGKLEDKEDVAGKVALDNEEADLVLGGEDLNILLEVNDISETVSTEEKAKIEEKITDNTMGLYLDVSLFKKIGTREKQAVHNTKEAVKIAFEVPENLRNKDEKVTRTYKIMRLHNGEVTMMDGVYDKVSSIVSFETDKFSTYALVYKDTQITSDPTDTPSVSPTDTPSVSPSTKPEVSPSIKPETTKTPVPTYTAEEKKLIASTISEKETEALVKNTDTEKQDSKGATFYKLKLKATGKKKAVKLTWKKQKGADGYIIYGSACGKGQKVKRIKTITKGTKTSWTQKKLKTGKYYKYIVVAYKKVAGEKRILTTSRTAHAVTTGGKYTNVSKITVNKKKLVLKKGKTATIKAKYKAGKKVQKHIAIIRYESSNKKVATVTRKGKVKAKGKGSCTIYVYTQNGLYKTVKVKVK